MADFNVFGEESDQQIFGSVDWILGWDGDC